MTSPITPFGLRRSLAVAVTLAAGFSLVAIPHAQADEPYQPRPSLTIPSVVEFQGAEGQRATLRWTDNRNDETGWRVYRVYPNGGGNKTLIGEIDGNSGTGTVKTLPYTWMSINRAACFYLHAVTGTANNNDSTTVCGAVGAPGKPGNPAMVWSDADRADVEFTRGLTYEGFYKVYVRRSDQTTWTVKGSGISDGGTAPAGNYRLRVNGLQPSTRYCFKVAGYHALRESNQTAEVCGSTVAEPTAGWTSYTDSFYVVKPYNVPVSDRFRIVGSRDFQTWVCKDDKPFAEGSDTAPRTEIAWENTYTSGQRMWEADVFIVGGTSDSNIMQIFHAESDHPAATDLRIRVKSEDGGTLRAYRHKFAVPPEPDGVVFASGMYDRWFNLKVAHNTAAHQIRIWIDDRLLLTIPDSGDFNDARLHRFKNGVYGSAGGAVDNNLHCPAGGGRAEAHFRYFKFWSRPA